MPPRTLIKLEQLQNGNPWQIIKVNEDGFTQYENDLDSMWVWYIWWVNEIPVLEKRVWRAKKNWTIIAYNIDSYDELWDPLIWDLNIFIYINDIFAWTASMYWLSHTYITDVSSWDNIIFEHNDKITYMVENNEWCKNIVLTLYYK